jgi:hypothetical protein
LLPLGVLVVLAMIAMTGFLGVRDGAYRGRGIVIGLVLVAAVAALFLSGAVR